jgi:hypothetical protein
LRYDGTQLSGLVRWSGTYESWCSAAICATPAAIGVNNLPVLLAGGGFRQSQHLNVEPQRQPPRSNLYVSMLQRLGPDVDRFGSSTGTLSRLEPAG